jgi:hypothetical protein
MIATIFFLYIPSLLGIVFGVATTLSFITTGKKRIASIMVAVGCIFTFNYLATTLTDALEEPVVDTVPTKTTKIWI